MKFRKILSAMLSGVVAVTAAVSGLSVSAGAVSEKVIYTGYGYYLSYIPFVCKAAPGDEEGMFEYGKNEYYIVADLSPSDVVTFKAISENGKAYSLYMKLSSEPSYYVNQSSACYEKSGISVQNLIDCFNEDLHKWDYSNNYTGKNVSIDTVTNIAVASNPYIFADEGEDKKINEEFNSGNRFTWKITIAPSSSNNTDKKITVPTTVKAAAKSATSVAVTWKSTNADSYNIYRSTSKTGTYKKIGTSKTASYTDKGLTKGKTYYYKVTAVSGGKESEFSKVVSAKAVAPAPNTVKAVKAKSGAATITWSKSSGASGYEIYMSTSADSGFKKIKTSGAKSAASYTKTGLKSGQTYYFKIRTYTGVNGKKVYSGFSKVVKVTV